MYAALNRQHMDIVQLVADLGADVNKADNYGQTGA